jgi:hypothetical protein
MIRILALIIVLIAWAWGAPSNISLEVSPGLTKEDVTPDRCATLCRAGLGGLPCGCPPEVVNSMFHKEVQTWRLAHPEEQIIFGPRRDLCPSLCEQNLGQPLCKCANYGNTSDSNLLGTISLEDWCPICHDILYTEYATELWVKLGCHDSLLIKNCKNKNKITRRKSKRDLKQIIEYASSKNSESEVDWDLWCEVQCDSNNGALACNCDMLPLAAH